MAGDLGQEIDQSKIDLFEGMDIGWLLNEWAVRAPDKDFMIWEPFEGPSESWSYLRFQNESKRVAHSLSERGVKAGDFVIIHLENSPEFMLSWFACAQLGAVAVSTNTHCVARDMQYFYEHTQAVCAITQPSYASMIQSACHDIEFIAVTDNNAGETALIEADIQAIAFADLLLGDELLLPTRTADSMANLSIQFTSGTTSRPKAVLWTHANALWGAKISASHMRLRHEDRTLIYMPMFHTNALTYSMLPTLWAGATFVLQPKFSASRFWPISLKYQLTWASMIPFAIEAIFSQANPGHNYRFWGMVANVPIVTEMFNLKMIGWWGMTETLTQGIVTDVDHPGPSETIGRVAPEYEIQIRKEDGTQAQPGERGLLFIRGVRGVSLFKEYYRNEAANKSAFDENGWFETGDIIRVDDSGYLFFSDRDKDMLKVGAENVAASEIEIVVMETGLVNECAVVAQKHHMLDEVPVVFVIPNAQAPANIVETILQHCVVNLASFKVPKAVHLVDELPRSTLEKVAKNELRKRLPAITK
jgi:crotonobetaine/carnitine-CoA ligase|tara:strand:- start:333 stop:1928 length:1596 start_codon:yes stop_codon:yes gene_type:complete